MLTFGFVAGDTQKEEILFCFYGQHVNANQMLRMFEDGVFGNQMIKGQINIVPVDQIRIFDGCGSQNILRVVN